MELAERFVRCLLQVAGVLVCACAYRLYCTKGSFRMGTTWRLFLCAMPLVVLIFPIFSGGYDDVPISIFSWLGSFE